MTEDRRAYKESDAHKGCDAHSTSAVHDKHDIYDILKLQNQVCFPLYACSKELVRQYGPHLKKLNLTYTQYIVMMVMWERETVSSRELARLLHLDYGTLTPVLKRLDQAGYLTRKRATKDERLLTLTLTDEGRELKAAVVAIPAAAAECMGLTQEEFDTLDRLTYKALRNMEAKAEENRLNSRCGKRLVM